MLGNVKDPNDSSAVAATKVEVIAANVDTPDGCEETRLLPVVVVALPDAPPPPELFSWTCKSCS